MAKNSTNVEIDVSILENRDAFALKLGLSGNAVGEKLFQGAEYLGGGTVGAVLGYGASYVAWSSSLGLWGQLLVTAGIGATAPIVAPVTVGGVAGLLLIGGWRYLRSAYANATTLQGQLSHSSPLTVLASVVADVVFIPAVLVMAADGEVSQGERQCLLDMMAEWGYSKQYAEQFVLTRFKSDRNAMFDEYTTLLKHIKAAKGRAANITTDVTLEKLRQHVASVMNRVIAIDGFRDVLEESVADRVLKSF